MVVYRIPVTVRDLNVTFTPNSCSV